VQKPRLLDLFCGGGGATYGYQQAGFHVVGVDLEPQPRYIGDAFHLADAVTFPLGGFDVIHASPPCQGYSGLSHCRPGVGEEYPQLIDIMRTRLKEQGGVWVIENVEGSGLPAQDDLFGSYGVMLCGSMFGLKLYRHRYFETSFPIAMPHHPRHLVPAHKAGHRPPPGMYVSVGGRGQTDLWAEAMQIDWLQNYEMAEAIPPAFSCYIGGVASAFIA
jgi:DNA (cytosine-5)-methyltransferase 1